MAKKIYPNFLPIKAVSGSSFTLIGDLAHIPVIIFIFNLVQNKFEARAKSYMEN